MADIAAMERDISDLKKQVSELTEIVKKSVNKNVRIEGAGRIVVSGKCLNIDANASIDKILKSL